ncbi:MAG: hypothetical protein K2K05_10530, partial [Muribaculaceae bacterium]|nr:hypothetical protein [Muribaculaceae bacterium]
ATNILMVFIFQSIGWKRILPLCKDNQILHISIPEDAENPHRRVATRVFAYKIYLKAFISP